MKWLKTNRTKVGVGVSALWVVIRTFLPEEYHMVVTDLMAWVGGLLINLGGAQMVAGSGPIPEPPPAVVVAQPESILDKLENQKS